MTTTSRHPHPSTRRRRSSLGPAVVAAAVTILAVAVALAVAVGSDTGTTSGDGGDAIVRTGEQNAMGMPVIETPGTATGSASAGAVQVANANWALGTVPLNTAVRPSWVLRNTGVAAVTIGEPHPEVREGCCPGAFSIGTRTLEPGAETTMSFELSMHPGMDGWHDFAVHVPVQSEGGEDVLTLGVTGDFRDA